MAQKPVFGIGDKILFGAAYYPEYQPVERSAEDFRLMKAAGFNLIRVGESVWSTWQPSEDQFDLEWLQPTLDAAHAHDIGVVLGTPTYAVPPWLMIKHREIAAESETGVRVPWGVRQETDTSHPTFLRYAEIIIRAVVGRYADHPSIIGFQVDNEPGQQVPHNAHVFDRFKRWLIDKHGDVATINRVWNLTHWAHRLNHIDELWVPDGNHVPQYDLDWRRFQAELTTEYVQWQAEIVREYASDHQFVTTCIDLMRPAVDDRTLGAATDVAAVNQYMGTQDQLSENVVGDFTFPPTGSWAPFFASDRNRAVRQENFMVTETNATSIGHPWFNFPFYDGQWRQLAWSMIARGARAIEYWHWHSMHGSWETYWTGILPHSFEPGRVYEQVAALGNEIAAAGSVVEGIEPDATTGLLFSMPTRWAFNYHPPLQADSAHPEKQGEPDRDAYERILYRFYGGLSRAGHQMQIIHAEDFEAMDPVELAKTLPNLAVPALYLMPDGLAAKLVAYAEAGGHLLLGVRSGYADEIGRPKTERQPAGLAKAAGLHYSEFSNLTGSVAVTGTLTGEAEGLIEGLIPDSADVLASYEHPHFGRWAAATTHEHGAGRVTYLGTLPSLELMQSLGEWMQADHPWRDQLVPGRIFVHGALNGAGERLWFVHNFAHEPSSLTPPMPVADAISGAAIDTLDLGGWDVRILREVGK